MNKIPAGETRPLPNERRIIVTDGVSHVIQVKVLRVFRDYTVNDYWLYHNKLEKKVEEEYKKMPDVRNDGGNDKYFFSFKFLDVKMWAVANEVGGLTVMLPEEY